MLFFISNSIFQLSLALFKNLPDFSLSNDAYMLLSVHRSKSVFKNFNDRKSDVIWREFNLTDHAKIKFWREFILADRKKFFPRSILTKENVQQKGKCIVEID